MNLLKEIETRNTRTDNIYIFFLGQAGYVIKSPDAIVYIDPYLSNYVEHPNGLNKRTIKRKFPPIFSPEKITTLDAILITHAHHDHMDPWTLEAVSIQYMLYCTETAYRNNSVHIKSENIVYVNPGHEYNIKDIAVTPVLSAHYELYDRETGKPIGVSYILKILDKTFYFWGDGVIYHGLLDFLSKYSFNYFFAPINGRDWVRENNNILGNINITELIGISKELNIDFVVPNHFDMFDCNAVNPEHFLYYLNKMNPAQKYRILKCGEHIKIE